MGEGDGDKDGEDGKESEDAGSVGVAAHRLDMLSSCTIMFVCLLCI